jgi:hypothetical protein
LAPSQLRRDYPEADEKRIHQLFVERVNYMQQEEDELRAKMARLGIAP